ARVSDPDLAGQQRAENQDTAVGGRRSERSARALYRSRTDRGRGSKEQRSGLVLACGQRRPWLRPQAERRLPVLRSDCVRRGAVAEIAARATRRGAPRAARGSTGNCESRLRPTRDESPLCATRGSTLNVDAYGPRDDAWRRRPA